MITRKELTDQEKIEFIGYYERLIWHGGREWANEYEPNEKGFLELKKDLSRIEKKYGNKLSDFKKTKLIQLTNRYEDGVKELWNNHLENYELTKIK